LKLFLRNQGIDKLPGLSTIDEGLNALSDSTREYILQSQLALIADQGMDDFSSTRIDSTHIVADSAYPTDSNTLTKLIGRLNSSLSEKRLARFQLNLPEVNFIADCHQRLKSLNYSICSLTSASAKQADALYKEEVGENKATEDKESHASGETAKQRKRRQLYEEYYEIAEAVLKEIRSRFEAMIDKTEGVSLPPSLICNLNALKESCKKDVDEFEKLLNHSRERICDGKIPSAKDGIILSVSDPNAAFIVKGGWERVFGYKPQIAFSSSGFTTAIVIPEGNAADRGQFITIAEKSMKNTGIIPQVISVDDGYTSAENLAELQEREVEIVSFSGTHGRKLLGEELWENKEYSEARRARNTAEGGISYLKNRVNLEQCTVCGIDRVRREATERIIAANALRIRFIRRKLYKERTGVTWESGLPNCHVA
jgi:IS5 family transposase